MYFKHQASYCLDKPNYIGNGGGLVSKKHPESSRFCQTQVKARKNNYVQALSVRYFVCVGGSYGAYSHYQDIASGKNDITPK